ncbi:MAG: 16S rRNA (cytosine(1402)-N(4))-methyltransferase RsmH [Clostridia bacterium]|nr:16S rRNA (cytosine(1402)-N(4))-methyltransferase RsmH [Clostridia bacterium]
MEFNHRSVLLNETVELLNIKPDGIYVDGTVGGAGHATEIAKRLTSGRLIAFDRDPDAISVATERLEGFGATLINDNFNTIDKNLEKLGISAVDGVLLDLGVSSYQLDNAERGFSYHKTAPLDMRMSKEGLSAYDVVNNYSLEELTRIMREYGEERFAYKIANEIIKQRGTAPITTTTELAEIISAAVPASYKREGHPARKCFQAIRIEVNGEISILADAIEKAFSVLKIGGRLSIITFHSLEDRIVKQKFKEFATGCTCPPDLPICVCGKTPRGKLITKKPVIASEEELADNQRSRSAKLRVVEKIG